MTSDKQYSPETISDQALPITQSSVIGSSSSSGSQPKNQYSPDTVPNQQFPEKIVAVEVASSRFNSQTGQILGEFTFSTLGAISIGTYENGVSGDVRITPNGIVARNVNGDTTFSLDGATGDATFKGTLQAGTVIAGAMEVGDPNVVIDGVNGRIIVNDGSNNRVLIGKHTGGF